MSVMAAATEQVAELASCIAERTQPGAMPRELLCVNFTPVKDQTDYGSAPMPEVADRIETANALSSRSTEDPNLHYPVLDFDFPAMLIPSSTPGHFHLYIEKAVQWDKFIALMDAMVDAELLEPGYAAASVKRGYSTVRLPWVKKGEQ